MAKPFVFALTKPDKVRSAITNYFNALPVMTWQEIYDPDIKNEDGTKGAKVWKEMQTGCAMPGIAGLSYELGINRQAFLAYCKMDKAKQEVEGMVSIVHDLRRAKARIETFQEQGLFDKERHRGSMFSLTVNYKWRDDPEGEQTGEGFTMNITPPAPQDTARAIPVWEPDE